MEKLLFAKNKFLQTSSITDPLYIYLCSNLIGAKNVVNINGTFLF